MRAGARQGVEEEGAGLGTLGRRELDGHRVQVETNAQELAPGGKVGHFRGLHGVGAALVGNAKEEEVGVEHGLRQGLGPSFDVVLEADGVVEIGVGVVETVIAETLVRSTVGSGTRDVIEMRPGSSICCLKAQ